MCQEEPCADLREYPLLLTGVVLLCHKLLNEYILVGLVEKLNLTVAFLVAEELNDYPSRPALIKQSTELEALIESGFVQCRAHRHPTMNIVSQKTAQLAVCSVTVLLAFLVRLLGR